MDFYHLTDGIKTVYDLLQDDLSRNVFWARLQFDVEPTMDRAIQLLEYTGGFGRGELAAMKDWKNRLPGNAGPEPPALLLYGAGALGRSVAGLLRGEGEDFFAFCDRKAEGADTEQFVDGKRIYPPSYLIEHMEHCCVIIAVTDRFSEIERQLLHRGFPQDHILPLRFARERGWDDMPYAEQYFEFPEKFRQGTSFIDAGCFDGRDSIAFARWCGGRYERILAFEPDRKSCDICRKRMMDAGLSRFEVIQSALAACEKTVSFAVGLNTNSHVFDEGDPGSVPAGPASGCGNVETVHAAALDSYTDDMSVGFIKMDIEGAEMDALNGARQTIERDKPFLALSVYHRRGDVLAIMERLHGFVPEYRFWLRHYGPLVYDTVLYASL